MKQTIDSHQFRQAFHDCGRASTFSLNGTDALFDYLEELGDGCGEEMELDVIALCCDYSEHASAIDCVNDNGYDWMSVDDQNDAIREFVDNELGESDDDNSTEHEARFAELVGDPSEVLEKSALEYLQENTQVITFDGGIIIQGF